MTGFLLKLLRASPRDGPAGLPSQGAGRGYWARGEGELPHKQHSIPPINSVCHLQCASSTLKIPSANLLFQSHPPNTEDACSLILLQCIREARQRGPPRPSPMAFMQCPPWQDRVQGRWWRSSWVNSAALQADQGLLQRLVAMLLPYFVECIARPLL
jgi:hypothetical protein